MKKGIIIGVAALLIVGGAAGGFFLWSSNSAEPVADPAAAADGAPEVEETLPDEEPIYLPLSPAFVVNFEHNGSIRYLQLSIQVMAYDQEVIDKVEANFPAVRNALILLFSGQDYDALNTLEGKENLRQAVLDSVNEVVRFTTGAGVKDVFFTGFVMQ